MYIVYGYTKYEPHWEIINITDTEDGARVDAKEALERAIGSKYGYTRVIYAKLKNATEVIG